MDFNYKNNKIIEKINKKLAKKELQKIINNNSKQINKTYCRRCEYTWIPRKPLSEIKRCPYCHSTKWRELKKIKFSTKKKFLEDLLKIKNFLIIFNNKITTIKHLIKSDILLFNKLDKIIIIFIKNDNSYDWRNVTELLVCYDIYHEKILEEKKEDFLLIDFNKLFMNIDEIYNDFNKADINYKLNK